MSLRAVIDTNVVIAGHRTSSNESPNAELLAHWQAVPSKSVGVRNIRLSEL